LRSRQWPGGDRIRTIGEERTALSLGRGLSCGPEDPIDQVMVRSKAMFPTTGYGSNSIPGASFETEKPAFLSSGEYKTSLKFREHRKFEGGTYPSR
jgi:hypothetical protein